ncbi:hypothetical protein NMD1_03358 [Novosphingobium sp. MD-1]|nr:hypothetical protein NMD1_03358 [Novosphingobium sp. MD-1]
MRGERGAGVGKGGCHALLGMPPWRATQHRHSALRPKDETG